MARRLSLSALVLAFALLLSAAPAWADRWWVGGTGNWSDNTNHWSASDGGAPGASLPISTDNCFFDNLSTTAAVFTVTVNTSASCANFDASGVTLTADKMTLAGSSALTVFGSWNNPGSTLYADTTTGARTFASTSTGNTITTNGVTMGASATNTTYAFNGVGGGWTLSDALTIGSSASNGILSFVNGTFDTSGSNFALTAPRITNAGTGTVTLNLNGSTVTANQTSLGVGWEFANATGLTLNAGTSTINVTGGTANSAPLFAGGGLTYNNVAFNGAGSGKWSITGANTYNNLTLVSPNATGLRLVTVTGNQVVTGTFTPGAGGTANRRLFVESATIGTVVTITAAAVAAISDVDFRDITAAGASSPWSGTRIGNCGGNTNITASTPKTVYWNLAGSQNWSANGWATTNNGSPATANFPLAQDTATFTEAGSAGTVTLEGYLAGTSWNVGNVQMADGVSNRVTGFTLATSSNNPNFFGNINLFSGLTVSGTGGIIFAGSGSQTLNSAGVAFTQPVTINGPGGTYTLAGNSSFGTQTLTVANGTVSDGGFNLTAGGLAWGAGTGNLTFDGGNWIISGSGTAWSANTNVTGKTTTRTISTGQIQMTSASAKTFAGGALAYPVLVQAGAGALTVQQSNTLSDLQASTLPSTITLTSGTTQTMSNFTLAGTSGNLATLNASTAGTFATVVKTSGTVDVSYVSLKDSHASGAATWKALLTNGNVNVSGNAGWSFVATSAQGSGFFLFFGPLSLLDRARLPANDNTLLSAAA